jgi:predicted DsbA family dithiol-disulfide isomerase/uncharacterized membrane protein
LLVVQVNATLVLSVSSALLVDHLGDNSAYCQANSGCVAAKEAALRWFGPVPVPAIGLIGFAVLLGLSLFVERRGVRRLLLASSVLGATIGLAFLVVQAFVLKRFCPGCVLVDGLAIVGCVATLLLDRVLRKTRTFTRPLRPLVVGAFASVAVVVPVLWPQFRPVPTIAAPLMAWQTPERTTLVEFVDLQCSHCKALYPTLEQLRREYGTAIAVRRFHVPAERHLQARQAARLLTCTSTTEQSERLERALFETMTLSERTLRDAARSVGMTERSIDECWTEPASARAVQQHIELFRKLGRFGLPTVFIGGERITGDRPAVVYRAAIARARRSPSSANAQTAAFFGLVILLLVTLYFAANRSDRASEQRTVL